MKHRFQLVLLLAFLVIIYTSSLSSWSKGAAEDLSTRNKPWSMDSHSPQQQASSESTLQLELEELLQKDDEKSIDNDGFTLPPEPVSPVKTDVISDTAAPCTTYDCVNDNPSPLTPTLPLPGAARKANAVIVILCRNSELDDMRRSLREFEDRFNRRYHYPYVFLNDDPFDDDFMASIRAMTESVVEFGQVPNEMWSVPEWVDEQRMHQCLLDYRIRGVLYGGSLSYRHMCRFNSGWFYRHPLIEKYDYYWRVEPGVHFFCDLLYDPFLYMQDNGKEYGFTITLKELPETIPTLWATTMEFAKANRINTTLLRFFSDEYDDYNLCHYWSNFEIASLNLWRDPKYQAYFDYLDQTGNFFYERWGDAIVHSLAAGMFLRKDQVHFFDDIGYQHDNFAHCTEDGNLGTCLCPLDIENFDDNQGSCLS
ncbi:glycosyl transferase, partial [Hesseltinella vesiculosa]